MAEHDVALISNWKEVVLKDVDICHPGESMWVRHGACAELSGNLASYRSRPIDSNAHTMVGAFSGPVHLLSAATSDGAGTARLYRRASGRIFEHGTPAAGLTSGTQILGPP